MAAAICSTINEQTLVWSSPDMESSWRTRSVQGRDLVVLFKLHMQQPGPRATVNLPAARVLTQTAITILPSRCKLIELN